MSSSVPVLSCLLSYTADNLTTTTAAALHINTKALIHQHHQTGAGTRHHQKHGHERNLCTAHRGGRICYLNIVLPMQCFRWLRFTMAGRHGNISATIAKKERKRDNTKQYTTNHPILLHKWLLLLFNMFVNLPARPDPPPSSPRRGRGTE